MKPSQALCDLFILRDAAREVAVYSTGAIHKTRNSAVQPVQSFH